MPVVDADLSCLSFSWVTLPHPGIGPEPKGFGLTVPFMTIAELNRWIIKAR
jgi:hypothetical protein